MTSESEQQGAKCGPQNATRSTKDVLKTTSFSNTLKSFPPRVLNIYGGWGQILGGVVRRDSRVFVGLYAKNDVLVGTAPRLLAQEQTGGQAR